MERRQGKKTTQYVEEKKGVRGRKREGEIERERESNADGWKRMRNGGNRR